MESEGGLEGVEDTEAVKDDDDDGVAVWVFVTVTVTVTAPEILLVGDGVGVPLILPDEVTVSVPVCVAVPESEEVDELDGVMVDDRDMLEERVIVTVTVTVAVTVIVGVRLTEALAVGVTEVARVDVLEGEPEQVIKHWLQPTPSPPSVIYTSVSYKSELGLLAARFSTWFTVMPWNEPVCVQKALPNTPLVPGSSTLPFHTAFSCAESRRH
jgi:hypothetical protein